MPIFKLDLKGQGLLPQTTPIRDLVEFLSHIETSVLETARKFDVEMTEGEVSLSLVEIEEGSNRLSIAVAPVLVSAIQMVTEAVRNENYSQLPPRAHQSLYAIYLQASKRGWEVSLQEGETLDMAQAMISVEHPVPKPGPELVNGTTTVFGRCIRVGGAEPRADVRLSNRTRLLHVEVTEPIAKQLAKNLYENVAITGEVWWDASSWEIVRLKAHRVANFQAGSISETFREMAEIIGDRWSNVDAEQFVASIRSDREDEENR